jgi:tetratricopeptide (TPR) repeat protein
LFTPRSKTFPNIIYSIFLELLRTVTDVYTYRLSLLGGFMVFNLSQLDNRLLLDKNKLRLVTERIVNNLYQNSEEEEDILSLLNQEEEAFPQPHPDEEDLYIMIAKSKILTDIEFLFKFEMSMAERLFLSSLIIQLSLRGPHFIIFYNTPNSLYEDIDSLINSVEIIKESWNGYTKDTGNGDFLEFLGFIFESSDISENTKEATKHFAPYIHLDYIDAFHLTSRPFLEGSKIYNQDERPVIFIWIPSDPEFKLVVEFDDPFSLLFSDEITKRDSILKMEGFQIIRYDEVEITHNPIEKANEFYEYLVAYSKKRTEEQKNGKGLNIRRTTAQWTNKAEEQSLDEGQRYYEDGNYLEALTGYQKAAQLNPNSYFAHIGMGYALQKLDRNTEALEAFSNAIRSDPFDAFAYKSKGYVLINLNRYTEALETFNEALNHEPDELTALYGKGRALFLLGKYSEALDIFNHIIQIKPDIAYVYANKGEAHIKLNDYEDALVAINQAIHLDPNNADFYNKRGEALSYLGEYVEALKDYDKALHLEPKYSIAYKNKGDTLVNLERCSEALNCYEEAIRLDPNDRYAYEGKSKVLFMLERYTEGSEAFLYAYYLSIM